MKKLFTILVLTIVLLLGGNTRTHAQTSLSTGDIVIVAINGDVDTPNNYGRGFSFMPLVNLSAGTVIYFTDYGWSDATNYFITNAGIADAFIHYTAPSTITAGTIIRCDQYTNTNFTFDYTVSGTGSNNYLNTAGLTNGDELLIFQASYNASTHVFSSINFIAAASIVSTAIVPSGWATNVGANGTDGNGNGSALPPGLTDDVNALSFNNPATSNDNCAYSGTTTAATKAGWQDRIKTYSNWTFNDAIPIPTPPTGPFTVTLPAVAPTATTQAATSITATGAMLNGSINANGASTTVTFEYGLTTGYGTIVTADQSPVTGSSATSVSKSITGLTESTPYHYRVVGVNAGGTTNGLDQTFTTLAVAPATQASAIVFSSVQTTQMTISWTNGNGSKRAVFVKEGSGAITNPTDNTTYTASANWASKGTQLGSSGYYCVYNNNSNTFTLTGLSSATQYTVQIFEYNGPALGEKYNVTTATNNPKSQTSNSLIKYVDASKADDSGDGFTWASAKKTLQAAIDLSVSGDQVWIKTGTYIPTTEAGGTGTRYKTFTLKEGVAIYGGFAGTETSLTERVVKNNPTILSGDLSGNDNYTVTPWTNTTENAYHVIYMPGTLNLTNIVILDGLIISGGNANETVKGGLHATNGGGMYFEGSPSTVNAVKINNCILRNNHAINGGAIYTLIPYGGGSLEPTFTNCLFYSNKADNGGAYAGSGFCQLYFNSCTFTGNTALTYGGAFYSAGYSMQYFYNSIFWNNTASIGKQFYITMPNGKSAGGCYLTNCCFAYETNDVVYSPNWASFLFNSTDGITTDPQFINPVTADFRIYGTSPCVNSGVNGHNTETKDIRGETRVQNTTIDIGAYEWTNGIDPASSCENAITVTNNNSSGAGSFQQALLDLCEGGTITLNVAVEWPNNITITKNLTLDLHGYSFSNTGNYTALIDDGKAVGIKNTASGGSFNMKIAFAATGSTLALYSESVLGSGFSVSVTSPAPGLLQIGDGTTSITHTYTTSDPKFNSKISKILVKNSAGLILNPPFDKK